MQTDERSVFREISYDSVRLHVPALLAVLPEQTHTAWSL